MMKLKSEKAQQSVTYLIWEQLLPLLPSLARSRGTSRYYQRWCSGLVSSLLHYLLQQVPWLDKQNEMPIHHFRVKSTYHSFKQFNRVPTNIETGSSVNCPWALMMQKQSIKCYGVCVEISFCNTLSINMLLCGIRWHSRYTCCISQ